MAVPEEEYIFLATLLGAPITRMFFLHYCDCCCVFLFVVPDAVVVAKTGIRVKAISPSNNNNKSPARYLISPALLLGHSAQPTRTPNYNVELK